MDKLTIKLKRVRFGCNKGSKKVKKINSWQANKTLSSVRSSLQYLFFELYCSIGRKNYLGMFK